MRSLLVALAFLAPNARSFGQTTWYVDVATCTGNGSGSASDPFCQVQEAIDAASPGDVIVVRAGVYDQPIAMRPIRLSIVGAGRDATFLERASSSSYEARPVLRVAAGADLTLESVTVRAGAPGILAIGARLHLRDAAIVENHGFPEGFDESGAGIHARLCALRLDDCDVSDNRSAGEGGGLHARASDVLVHDSRLARNDAARGGGIWIEDGSLVLRSCTLADNGEPPFSGILDGGGLYAHGTMLDVSRSTFEGNHASESGAAMAAHDSQGAIAECTFRENVVFDYDGALSLTRSPMTLRDCRFVANHTDFGWGGALYVLDDTGDETLVANCRFESNTAAEGGAALVRAGSVRFERCEFRANDAWTFAYQESGWGGALFVQQTAHADVVRCTFTGNTSRGYDHAHDGEGGAVWGNATLSSCTLVDNEVSGNVGGATGGAASGGAKLANCIAWGNRPDAFGTVTLVEWCDVEGGWAGTGNFDADPELWGPGFADLHLVPGSPCIDAGDPTQMDDDGTRLDVGAFAFDASHCGRPGTYCTAKQTSGGCTPAIGWIGTPSVAGADDFHVVATGVTPGELGILIWGTSGAASIPFLGGTLCVEAPHQRTAPAHASAAGGCDAVLDFAFDQERMRSNGLSAGDRLHFQVWFRDPQHSDGTGAGLTDGLEAVLCAGQ